MQQLDLIYQTKPNAATISLEFLNIRDITVFVPKLKLFKYLETLSLHGNKLTYLPSLEILFQLRQLDISNNPIKIDNKLMDSLFSIPNLQSLIIDIRTQDQRQLIVQNLPKLNYLNEKQIQRKQQIQIPRQKQMKIIRDKLAAQQKNAKTLLNNIYNMLDENNAPPDTTEDFSFSLKCIVEQFQYFYENINSSLARECVYLYYKNKLYQVVDTNLSCFLEDNGHQNIATAIDQINKAKKQGFEDILKVALSYAYEEDYSKKTVEPGNKLRKETLYQNQITRLKKQVSDLMKENQQLHYANQKYLEKIYYGGKNGNLKSKSNLNLSRRENNQNKILRVNTSNLPTPVSRSSEKNVFVRTTTNNNSNNQQLNTPTKNDFIKTPSKSIFPSPSKGNLAPSNVKKQYQQIDKAPSYRVLPKFKQQQIHYPTFEKTNSMASLSVKRLKPVSSTKSIHRLSNNQNEQQTKRLQKSNSFQQKRLTLDQMVQFVDDFIYQKSKFNIQCVNKGDIFQTPQQFLFTYFLRKYGLKDMALEWSLLIIKAIQKFSKENIIIEVFGKILKNTIEQEFYAKFKDFRDYLNPSIPLLETFDASDIESIFYSVFPSSNREQFQTFLSKLQYQSVKGQKIYRRRSLLFKLQGFFIKQHQKQIEKYLNNFKAHDRDQDGIIQSEQIQKCISSFIKKYVDLLKIYQSEQNIANVFEQIMAKRRKKGNTVSMTFSQFVSILRDYF